MTVVSGDFELTIEELRCVARYVVESAEEVLPVFEAVSPDDPRPRAAVDAAWEFVNGARRTNLQRRTSLDAHRAAKEAPTEAARLAARAACERRPPGVRPATSALQIGPPRAVTNSHAASTAARGADHRDSRPRTPAGLPQRFPPRTARHIAAPRSSARSPRKPRS
ncbi:exonuclease SbcC [Rhodococcus hoagii]|nr:exonuclease SbcC [Prescottella equi]